MPAPVAISSADLLDPATAEQYEGVLVTLSGETVTEGPDTHGDYTLESGATVDDAFFTTTPTIPLNMPIPTITGIVKFSFGKYRVLPRDAADLTLP